MKKCRCCKKRDRCWSGMSCDEYPMASVRERTAHAMAVRDLQNQVHSRFVSEFYDKCGIRDGVKFTFATKNMPWFCPRCKDECWFCRKNDRWGCGWFTAWGPTSKHTC